MIARFQKELADVAYKDWDIGVYMDGDRPYLQVAFRGAAGAVQKGRKWMLSPHMTKSEVVQTAFKAVLTAEEHEAREFFTYKGKAIFGPHFHVDTLVEACEAEFDVRSERLQ